MTGDGTIQGPSNRKGPDKLGNGHSRAIALFRALCLFALLSEKALCQSKTPAPENDVQAWTDLLATHPIRANTDLLLSGGFRLGRNLSHPVYERASAGLSFNVFKFLALSPQYSFFATQPVAGLHKRENRCSLGATFSAPLRRWVLSERSIFERRFIDPKDTTRFRTRLQLERPIRVYGVSLRGFFSDEVSYEWKYKAWTRNRFILGAGKNLGERISLDFYYMKQYDDRNRPGDLNCFGLSLNTRF